MKYFVYIFLLNILFIGCGSTVNDEKVEEKQTNITGFVVDGYIKNATVCIDENKNLNCDSNEPTTISDENGLYSFEYTLALNELVVILSQNGIDTAVDKTFKEKIACIVTTNRYQKDITADITPLTDIQTRKKLVNNDGILIFYKNPMQDKNAFAIVQKLQMFKKMIKSLDDKISFEDIKNEMTNLNIDASLNNLNLNEFITNLKNRLSFIVATKKQEFIKNQILRNKDIFNDLSINSNIHINQLKELQINIQNDTKQIIDKINSQNIFFMNTNAIKLTNLENELKKDKLNLIVPNDKFYDTPPEFPLFENIQNHISNSNISGTYSETLNSGYTMVPNRYKGQSIATIAPKADILLTYKNNQWFGYSPNETFKSDFEDLNIQKSYVLNENDAFWVFFNDRNSINLKGTNSTKKQIALKQGWNLVSLNNHDSYIVLKSYFKSEDIESIWTYSNYHKKWSAFSPHEDITMDIKNDEDITLLDTIVSNNALWIKSYKDINITIDKKAPLFLDENTTLTLHEDNISSFNIKAYDANGDNISYTLSGEDEQEFQINNNKIEFKIINSKPKKNQYSLTIDVTDGVNFISKDFIINITFRIENDYDGVYADINGNDTFLNKQLYLDEKHLNILHLHNEYNGSTTRPIVQVVEWGIQTSHEDLIANIDYASSHDMNNYHEKNEKIQQSNDAHGTAVAGIIAARGFNSTGIRGIIPFGKIAYFKRVINGGSSDSISLAWANGPRANDISVSNNSWGVCSNFSIENDKYLKYGSENLRDNKGRIYVMSAGNDRKSTSKCGANNTNLSSYLNNPYMIVVASMSIYDNALEEIFRKVDDKIAGTSTPGSNILVSAYGDGGVWSTNSGQYGLNYSAFGGTSAAAPMVSGAVGLLLEACPDLTYRDVKYLLATTATKIDNDNSSWVQTSANLDFSTDYGFGRMNITDAINMCKDNYTNLVEQKQFSITKQINQTLSNDGTSTFINIDSTLIRKIEWVAIYIEGQIDDVGDYEFNLISPSGTKIQLLHGNNGAGGISYNNQGKYDIKQSNTSINNSKPYKFRLSTVGLLNENSYGTFQIEISDKNTTNNQINNTIKAIKLEILAY